MAFPAQLKGPSRRTYPGFPNTWIQTTKLSDVFRRSYTLSSARGHLGLGPGKATEADSFQLV